MIVADADEARDRARATRPRDARAARQFDLPVPVDAPLPPRRRFPWGAVFWSALGGLVTLGIGLATTRLIEDLYARADWLGWFGAGARRARGCSRSSSSAAREIVGALPPRLDRAAPRSRAERGARRATIATRRARSCAS